jgi:4'-phosphopantetheinyl transferase
MASMMNIQTPVFQFEAVPALAENEVHLWRADLEALAPHEPRWQLLLSADEQKRAARFHFAADRQRFAAARATLRVILAGYLKILPVDIDFCYSKKDKPHLAPRHADCGITFNLSHSGGIALYAFARRRELGVDVERISRNVDVAGIARRFFSEQEQKQLLRLPADEQVESFFRCWTRKEAYIKATGDGLSLPLSQFDVSLEPGSGDALAATRPDNEESKHWLLGEVPAGDGYLAAICVSGRDWKLVSWNDPKPEA